MDGELFDHASLMKLGKDELCTIIRKLSNIGAQIKDLAATIVRLSTKIEKTEGELAVSNNANRLLAERVQQLEERATEHERVITNDGQYLRNKQIEIKRLPVEIAALPVPQLKGAMAGLLSLTEVNIGVDDIGKCHKLGGDGKSVIMEFRCREKRDEMLLGRKKLKNKADQMENLGMSGAIISESMCREYARLDFVCRMLKKRGEAQETWFFNGRLFIKLALNAKRIQVTHIRDLYERFGHEIIDTILTTSRRASR